MLRGAVLTGEGGGDAVPEADAAVEGDEDEARLPVAATRDQRSMR